nr:nucleotidyltransferase [Sulfolobales archaeon]
EVKMDSGELELTYGIQRLIEQGGEVYGILLEKERWLNVGDPDSYYDALNYTYNHY